MILNYLKRNRKNITILNLPQIQSQKLLQIYNKVILNSQLSIQLKNLIEAHYNATMSAFAQEILEKWEKYLPKFIKVLPEEYRLALIKIEEENLIKQ